MTGDLALTIGRQEADNIEFKSAVVDRDKICKAICALANDLPGRGEGYLVIGVADNGTSLGLAVTDDVLLAVRNFRNDGRLLPRPTFHVERAEYAGLPCVLVTVPAAISPPVSFDGRVFVPVGPSTQVATPDEERVLRERRQAADLPFDQQPVPGSSMAELDLELFASTYLPAAVSPEVIRENQRTVEDQLASLRLLTPDASDPTVLGHLLIGLDPTAWIPGAYIAVRALRRCRGRHRGPGSRGASGQPDRDARCAQPVASGQHPHSRNRCRGPSSAGCSGLSAPGAP